MRSFVDAHAVLILRLARAAVRMDDRIDPSDVAQDVVMSLLQSGERGQMTPERIENPEAYLRVVVRNAVHRARTRPHRRERATEPDEAAIPLGTEPVPTPEEATRAAHDARKTLDAIKAQLRPRDAAAFALLVEDGMSIEEVARALGTNANNVYQMRHRILAVSREVLGIADPPAGGASAGTSGERGGAAR